MHIAKVLGTESELSLVMVWFLMWLLRNYRVSLAGKWHAIAVCYQLESVDGKSMIIVMKSENLFATSSGVSDSDLLAS